MDIKEQIVQEYLSGKGSYRQLAAKYGVSRDMVNKWVLIHQGIHNLPPTEQQRKYALSSMNSSPEKSSLQDKSIKELEQKIVALQKQLEWEKLRTEALNTMIDIAEKDLNISIRKKGGAQQ